MLVSLCQVTSIIAKAQATTASPARNATLEPYDSITRPANCPNTAVMIAAGMTTAAAVRVLYCSTFWVNC